MKTKYGLFAVVVLSLVLTLAVPVTHAQVPVPGIPGGVQASQAYVDALTYWYKHYFPQDWQTRLTAALTPEPSWDQLQSNESKPKNAPSFITNNPQAEQAIFTGVPANAWWMDAWSMELDGSWTKTPAIHPAGQAPGPVTADLMIQGKLPGVYVIRVVDKSGALIGEPKLIVLSWTHGTGGTWQQTFDVPSLPAALADQLANIKM